GSVKDNAAIRNRVPAPRDEEVGLDAPHVGGQDLPRNEDSAPRACAGKASLLERSPLPLRGRTPCLDRPSRTFADWPNGSSRTIGPSIRPGPRHPGFIDSMG